jgi:hypothetical protein
LQWFEGEGGAVVEECVSAPSPVGVFTAGGSGGAGGPSSAYKSNSESPRKRSATAGKKGAKGADQPAVTPRHGRTSLTKRVRKFGSWLRKTVAEKEYSALIVLVRACFFFFLFFKFCFLRCYY